MFFMALLGPFNRIGVRDDWCEKTCSGHFQVHQAPPLLSLTPPMPKILMRGTKPEAIETPLVGKPPDHRNQQTPVALFHARQYPPSLPYPSP